MKLPFRKRRKTPRSPLIPEIPSRYRMAAGIAICCAAIAATAVSSGMNEPDHIIATAKFVAASMFAVAPLYLGYRYRRTLLPRPNPGYRPAASAPRQHPVQPAPEPDVAGPAETPSAPNPPPGA